MHCTDFQHAKRLISEIGARRLGQSLLLRVMKRGGQGSSATPARQLTKNPNLGALGSESCREPEPGVLQKGFLARCSLLACVVIAAGF